MPLLPPPKPNPAQPFPPITTHPTALLSPQCSLVGTSPVTLDANAVVQLRAKVITYFGPVVMGESSLVSEKAIIGVLTSATDQDPTFLISGGGSVAPGPGVRLGRGVVVETRAVVEAEVVGEGTVVEVGGRVGKGARVGRYCKICAMCTVQPGEVIPDFTVVWGDGQRRTERKGLEGFRMKGTESHREVLRGVMLAGK